jgi:hypothetical protein
VNWGVVWTGVTAVLLGLVTNELFEWSPSLARRILRWAASWQADSPEEADLIYAEACEYLDAMPGRLSRVAWAIGRLRWGLSRSAPGWVDPALSFLGVVVPPPLVAVAVYDTLNPQKDAMLAGTANLVFGFALSGALTLIWAALVVVICLDWRDRVRESRASARNDS